MHQRAIARPSIGSMLTSTAAIVLAVGLTACGPTEEDPGPDPDPNELTVTAFSPADGATGVARNVSVMVTLSVAVDETTLDAVALAPTGGAPLAGSAALDSAGRIVTFLPDAALLASTGYEITVSAGADGLRSTEGAMLAEDVSASFQTAAADTTDTTAPQVVSIYPADGAEDVSLDSIVRVTFDEPIDCATATTIELVEWWDGNPQGGLVTTQISCSASDTVVTLTPAELFGIGDQYRVKVGTGVTDLAGNHLASEVTAVFDCAWVTPDNTPRVVSTWPEDGDTAVPTSASVRITFSKPMRQSTVSDPAVTLKPAGGGAAVTVIRETYLNPIFVLRPQQQLAAQTEYVLRIVGGPTGVEDEGGNSMTGDVEVRFVTGQGPAPDLQIVSIDPGNEAVGVDHVTPVTVTFDAPIDPSSVFLSYPGTAGSFRVSRWDDLSFPVEGALDFSDPTVVRFDIDPATTYELERTYHVGIAGGATGVRSLAGGRLAASFASSFTTKSPTIGTLADVRAASGVCAIRVPGVYMTFFRDQPSSHKGFFVQEEPGGPAILVLTYNRNPLFSVYPASGATGYPNIDLTVTRVDEYQGMKQVSAFSMTRNAEADADLAFMIETMVQQVGDTQPGAEHESEYLQIDGVLSNYRPGGSAENREYDLVWGTGRKVTLKISQFDFTEPMGLSVGSRVRVTAPLQRDDNGWFVKPYRYWDETARTTAELSDPVNYDAMLDIVLLAE